MNEAGRAHEGGDPIQAAAVDGIEAPRRVASEARIDRGMLATTQGAQPALAKGRAVATVGQQVQVDRATHVDPSVMVRSDVTTPHQTLRPAAEGTGHRLAATSSVATLAQTTTESTITLEASTPAPSDARPDHRFVADLVDDTALDWSGREPRGALDESVRSSRLVSRRESTTAVSVSFDEALMSPDSSAETVAAAGTKKESRGVGVDAADAPTWRLSLHTSRAIAAFQLQAASGAVAATSTERGGLVSPSTASSGAVLDAELPTQLVHAIRVRAEGHESGHARLRLHPSFLGEVTLGVHIEGATVSASLQASSPEVREWVRANEALLRQSLAEQGFHLERLVVVDEEQQLDNHDQGSRRQSADERDGRWRRQRRESREHTTFEVVL